MSLEEEAKQFMQNKDGAESQFKQALTKSVLDIIQYVDDNVRNSVERDQALLKLQEFGHWVFSAVDMYGIKPVLFQTEDVE